ncbi:MAG: flagellar biosynthesis protein FlhF [Clostridium sp.]|uniref:flagellar biosynthesis protein FlhF n=1 Tax=Clostridium sp. TaxID=1506 RepID=UPI003F337E67
MIIKKYVVSNMNEALILIRNELGKEAVIITQRKVRRKGISGFIKPKLIEVTAAIENSKKIRNTKELEEKKEENEQVAIEASINSIKKLMDNEISKKKEKKKDIEEKIENKKVEEKKNTEVQDLKTEILNIKNFLNQTLGEKEEKDYLKEFLETFDIDIKYYDEFKEEVININNKEETKEKIKEKLIKDINISEDKEIKGKVVLVGPTGVGKTTTIAKLAGKLSLKEGKRVGLITVDTYRIGAVDQLKIYAEIMDIQFKVVINGDEMEEAIKAMEDLDVVLIDSTGRSSKNIMQIRELKNLLSKANGDKTYLVLSSTTKNKDLENIIESYNTFDYDKVIVTKLDETTSYGALYNIQKESEKEIELLTLGQNVPEDIINASKEKLIDLIMLEESI